MTTASWYDDNADTFVNNTLHLPTHPILKTWLTTTPKDSILDLGCGAGRDTKAMVDAGWDVTAIDPSGAMIAKVHDLVGHPKNLVTKQSDAQSFLTQNKRFDRIWAMASLLHMPNSELPLTLDLSAQALNPDGQFFTCFKAPAKGDIDEVREKCGRTFTHLSLSGLKNTLNATTSFKRKNATCHVFEETATASHGETVSWTCLLFHKHGNPLT